jgi:hypothetical protein
MPNKFKHLLQQRMRERDQIPNFNINLFNNSSDQGLPAQHQHLLENLDTHQDPPPQQAMRIALIMETWFVTLRTISEQKLQTIAAENTKCKAQRNALELTIMVTPPERQTTTEEDNKQLKTPKLANKLKKRENKRKNYMQ